MISEFLEDEGFNVTSIHDGAQAIVDIISSQPDLVILDVMLPSVDGVEVCRKVRQVFDKPIIMLTASNNEFAEVSSLNYGADSYLLKPIKPQVLLAHIHATLRRSIAQVNTENAVLLVQDIELNKHNFSMKIASEPVEITMGEFNVLRLLMERAGEVVSRDDLYHDIRGIEYDGLDRSIDLRVSYLRKKMNDENAPYRYIKTVRNKGYVFAS